MGKTTAWPGEADPGQRSLDTQAPDPIPVALDFLRSCREERRPLALVTGASGTGKSMLMHRFLREVEAAPIAHLKFPTDDQHVFLETMLSEFGFDTFESTVSDLTQLARVYLAHESGKGLRPVVVVEDVDGFGPAVWSMIRELSTPEGDEKPTALFVLTGSPGFSSEAVAPEFDSVYSLDVTVRTSVPRDCGTLTVSYRDRPQGIYPLDQPKVAIGRSGENDIRIGGSFVSRFHAVIVTEEDGIYLVDLQSTNGTAVNGDRIERYRLRSGDRIGIEDFTLVYADAADARGDHPEPDDADELVMQAPLDHLLDQSA